MAVWNEEKGCTWIALQGVVLDGPFTERPDAQNLETQILCRVQDLQHLGPCLCICRPDHLHTLHKDISG